MPPPAPAGRASTSVAFARTASGALPIANERPATSNIGTSLNQSPTTTASAAVQPAVSHSATSAVPFEMPAARTISACLPGHWWIENVTVNNYGSDDDSADLAAGDGASDTFDPVDDADSSEDASWT